MYELLATSEHPGWALLGLLEVLCFQGSCVGRYISYKIYYLCTVFRAVRGKSVLGRREQCSLIGVFTFHSLFPHAILDFENAVFCGGDGQCPREMDTMGSAVLLLFDGGVWGQS